MFPSSIFVCSELRNTLAALVPRARDGRKLRRRHRSCDTEQLEVRQLLTGDFELAVTGGSTGADVARSVATDSAGNLYTTGSFNGTVDFDTGAGTVNLTSVGLEDIFVTKSDSSGGFLWARRFGGTGSDLGLGIGITATGSAVLTGSFSGTAGFDAISLTSAGSSDAFVTRLDFVGIAVWAVRVGGTSADIGNGVFVDEVAGVYVTGRFESVVDFDPGAGTASRSASGIDGFVLKLNAAGSFTWVSQFPNGIRFNGGTGPGDNLIQLIGVGNEGFSYEPSATTTGSGRLLACGMSVQFENTQNVGVRGSQNLSIEPQGSSDLLYVNGTTGFNNSVASKIQGVSGGVTITPLTFDNVRNITIDAGLRDQLLAQSNDAISFNAGSLEAFGLTSLFVRTGKGNDTVTINSADLGLPVSGGSFWVLGGSGADELIVTGDANWDLNDTRLVSSGGGRLAIDEVEKALITGGVSNNIIDT